MRSVALAVGLLLLAATPAGAVTLWVNGDTPAVRWQRIADSFAVPTPDVVVTVRFDGALAAKRCTEGSDGCYDGELIVGGTGPYAISIFRHEAGHLYRDLTMTDRDLAALLRTARLAYVDEPEEVVADLYMTCSVSTDPERASAYAARWASGVNSWYFPRVLRRACGWFRRRGAPLLPRPPPPQGLLPEQTLGPAV